MADAFGTQLKKEIEAAKKGGVPVDTLKDYADYCSKIDTLYKEWSVLVAAIPAIDKFLDTGNKADVAKVNVTKFVIDAKAYKGKIAGMDKKYQTLTAALNKLAESAELKKIKKGRESVASIKAKASQTYLVIRPDDGNRIIGVDWQKKIEDRMKQPAGAAPAAASRRNSTSSASSDNYNNENYQ